MTDPVCDSRLLSSPKLPVPAVAWAKNRHAEQTQLACSHSSCVLNDWLLLVCMEMIFKVFLAQLNIATTICFLQADYEALGQGIKQQIASITSSTSDVPVQSLHLYLTFLPGSSEWHI